MSRIISASRRTDIPAFYSEWFLNRLRAGHCSYWHPFGKQWLHVSLLADEVSGIVFWTKNLGPLLPHLPWVRERYAFYVHFTINDHPRELEPGIIPSEQAIEQARQVSEAFGVDALVWRFDPIVCTQHTPFECVIDRFQGLAQRMTGLTNTCVISFMSPYRRQARAFARAGLELQEPSAQQRVELSGQIAQAAQEHGMQLQACCNDDIVQGLVGKAHCIDPSRLVRVGARIDKTVPRAPSRDQCGCYRSVDIGAYDMCVGGCAYCYANQDHAKAEQNRHRHSPEHDALAQAFIQRDTEV